MRVNIERQWAVGGFVAGVFLCGFLWCVCWCFVCI